MTVEEYMGKLSDAIRSTMELCVSVENVSEGKYPCRGCALEKNEGKPCPLGQLIDVKRALSHAIETGINGITPQTDMMTVQVVTYLRRVVINGYSIRTLRSCSPDYIEERNLIEVNPFDMEDGGDG